ncbi:cyclopropane-fatty-acyl-phospholipid synthase [mine drainage metagenome]|uniref:Cyclopropane-fatty-acyl-phospholipid synthase n=1 Tax=mine drainage metagenome TaxID=410659 RepID=A0A1J5SBG0_9ZZZZ
MGLLKTDIVETWLAQRIRNHLAGKIVVPFNVRSPNDNIYRFGEGDPAFTISLKDQSALTAIARFDELRFTEAYINGSLDIEGDIWAVISCREILSDKRPLHSIWRRVEPLLAGQVHTNRRAIEEHYDYESEFYLKFMDQSRCYSQAVFERDDEPLETAQRRKLEFVVQSCGLKPGDRVLDVGGGWGTFVEYAGKQGIHVTALTIARKSEEFINDLIRRLHLPCEVIYGDFYEHTTAEPYDAIVILGVMEHLPDYPAVVNQLLRLLKPGGKIYLDASSFREKYSKPTFISRYVYPGNHRYFCLHDFLTQVAKTNLEVRSINNDRHSYYLTCREWAKNLDAERDEIVKRWGEKVYRIFRLYLWGSSYSFFNRGMDAFRLVLERPGI